MIIAAGLSPAWQQILLFDRFTPGEVNRAAQSHWCASGKVLNVGLGLHSLGAKSLTLSPLGGPAGEMIEREFAAAGAPLTSIRTANATRVCTTILDRATRITTELVEAAPTLSAEELEAFTSAFTKSAANATTLVLTGSLPAGAPATFYHDLLRAAPAVPAILDARGPELLAALQCKPLVVKPNREELGITFGRKITDNAELLAAMRDLNSRGAGWVIVSAGKNALLATSVDATYRLIPPAVGDPQNPIGCGDALTSGMAWGLSRGLPMTEAIRLGMAAASDRLRQLLPARLDARNVETIAAGIVAERLR